jgi:hypothetical protein
MMRLSLVWLGSSVLLLALLVTSLVHRLESFMPAEVRLILELMKNRFLR